MTSLNKDNPPPQRTVEVHHPDPSKIEYIIELIFDKFSKGIRLVGPLFAFALTVFISVVTHAFFQVILPYYTRQFGYFFGIILIFIAIFTLFNLLFNYFMAVLVKPGSMSDLKTSKYYKKHDPMKINNEIVDLNTIFNNSANKAGKPIQKESPEKNVFEFKGNKESTINKEDTLITLNTNLPDNKNIVEANTNSITEDSIDELTKNIDEKMGCVPKLNESDEVNCNFNENEINLLHLNKNQLNNDIKDNTNNIDPPVVIQDSSEHNKVNQENTHLNNGNNNINAESNPATAIISTPKINKCKFCKDLKVLRSHHCQVCGVCVFKMDHHCPWINNCVGHYNHRYFVLFLTWLMLGCIYVSIFSLPILFSSSTKLKKSHEFSFVSILCLVGMLLMTFFNTWNWFLVIKGNTTIEFWTLKSGFRTDQRIKDFCLPNWRDNIFLVFGTRSIMQAICCASRRRLPFSGLEWTRLAFPDYILDSEYYMEDNVSEEKLKMIVNSNV